MRTAASIVLLDFMRLKKKYLHTPGGPAAAAPPPWVPAPAAEALAATKIFKMRWYATSSPSRDVQSLVWYGGSMRTCCLVALWKERRKCLERTEGRREGNVVCLIFRDRFARIENDWVSVSHIPLSSIFLEVLNVNDYDFYHNEHEVN